jgi:hypothetical protein
VASLQQLEEQLERLQREIRAASERVRNSQTDDEARQAQADRQVLRDQAAEISRQITEIKARNTTNFVVNEDPGTGGVQIRTSDGLFVGGGFTLEEAKAAAIRAGANPSALQNLVDPRTRTAAAQGPQTDSAGATVAQANQARDDGAQTQTPAAPPLEAGADGRISTVTEPEPTNADTTPTQASAAEQSANIAPAPGPVLDPATGNVETRAQAEAFSRDPVTGALIINIRGSTAPPDDNTPAASNATQAAVAQRFQQRIEPRPNILDQYASYTYSLSLYLMSQEDYGRLLRENKKVLGTSQLLIQSGGAPVGERNQFFDLDFYIDNLQIKTFIQGKGTRSSHNTTELTFRIHEPNGITLFQRLYQAVQTYIGSGAGDPGTVFNYAAQHFLMIIRFYGYDAEGNVISAQRRDPAGTTDRDAITEKWIPFRFTGIKFRITNRITEYECSAVAPQNDLNTGRGRGILPFSVQVQGGTLGELLSGPEPPAEQPSTPPPPPASAGQSPRTVTTALQEALNRIQAGLVKPAPNAPFDKPDRYFFRILDPVLRDALVRPPGRADIARTAQANPTTAGAARDGRQQSVDPNSKYVSGYPGQSIIQFLDLAIRSSTYIADQQRQLETVDGITVDNPGTGVVAWYHIGLEARPREYDTSRGDWAYDFTYAISLYRVAEIISAYFPQGRFNGVHKRYDYWFTGDNTQILNFEQDFNYLYYITMNVRQPPVTAGAPESYREIVKRAFAAQSGESKQQGAANTSEGAANAADFLYSPGDQARNRISIVGDPDWIQQGSLWGGALNPSVVEAQYVNWLSDGSINFDTQEIIYEVGWNTPGDYNLETGIMAVRGQT